MYRQNSRSANRRVSLMDSYCARFGQLMDRKRAEMALVVAKQNAEKVAETAQTANRAKTEFLANVTDPSRAAAFAGRTGARTSAPRSSA